MGIEPTYPSEKYGYIIPESTDHVAEVRTFRENRQADVAEQYIAQEHSGMVVCLLITGLW